MKKKKNVNRSFDRKYIPLFLIGLVPIIVRVITIDTNRNIPNWNIFFGEFTSDYFNYYKFIALCIIGLVIAMFLVIDKKKNVLKTYELYKKNIWIIGAYALSIVTSAALSSFKSVAIFGISDRFEGALVLLSYLLILIYVLHVIRAEFDFKYIYYAIISGSVIVLLIAIWQSFGVNVFNTDIMKYIMGVPLEAKMIDYFNGNYAYSTLYNPNYLAQYCMLLIGVFTSGLFYFKNKKMKIFLAVMLAITIIIGYRTKTSSFYLGFVAAIGLAFLFNIKYIWNKLIGKVLIISIALAAIVGISVLSFGMISETTMAKLNKVSSVNYISEEDIYFEAIDFDKDHFHFDTNKGTLDIILKVNNISDEISLIILDDGESVVIEQNKNYVNIIEGKYIDFVRLEVFADKISAVFSSDTIKAYEIQMAYSLEDGFKGVNWYNDEIITDIYASDAAKLIGGNGKMFSRRLYFWVASLYNSKDNLLFGNGPDTFRICFDQTDIIGKLNTQHSAIAIIDKAHNDYINILVTTGLFSIIFYLTLLLGYIISSIKIYLPKRKKSSTDIMGYIITCTIFGYLILNLFIDSSIGVSPIMYLILGFGIVLNKINNKKSIIVKNK